MRFRNPSEIKKRGRGVSRGELDTLAQPHTKRKKKGLFSVFVCSVSSLHHEIFFSSPFFFFPQRVGKKREKRLFKKKLQRTSRRSQAIHLQTLSAVSACLLAGDRVEARDGRDGDDDRDEHDAAGDDRVDQVLERGGDLGRGGERGREHGAGGGGDAGRDLEGELLALGAVKG